MRNKRQWNFDQNESIFTEENAFENVFCNILSILYRPRCFNTIGPDQNGRHFADDIFKFIFVYKTCILIDI